jgi:hypothetical protein
MRGEIEVQTQITIATQLATITSAIQTQKEITAHLSVIALTLAWVMESGGVGSPTSEFLRALEIAYPDKANMPSSKELITQAKELLTEMEVGARLKDKREAENGKAS